MNKLSVIIKAVVKELINENAKAFTRQNAIQYILLFGNASHEIFKEQN